MGIQQKHNNTTRNTDTDTQNTNNCTTIVSTVLTTLPVRSASQGESFAFIRLSKLHPHCIVTVYSEGFFMRQILTTTTYVQ